jgi:hypothetical protein
MRRHLIVLIAAVCGISVSAPAQYRVDARNRGERVIAVVPMIGSGTPGDPRRPLFVPTPAEMRTSAIYEFTYQLSDEGNRAIVEFVLRDKASLDAIVKDSRTIKAFEKGKHQRKEIESEVRKHKKDYQLGPVVVPGAMPPTVVPR